MKARASTAQAKPSLDINIACGIYEMEIIEADILVGRGYMEIDVQHSE